jgi:hypothetical protein
MSRTSSRFRLRRGPAVACEALRKELKDLKFDLNCSVRYHASQQKFYENVDFVVNTANLVLGSWAVFTLISPLSKGAVVWATAIVALLSFINLSLRSAERSARHSQFRQQYFDLLRKVRRVDLSGQSAKQDLLACQDSRLVIEREEPPVNDVVNLIAYNRQMIAQGEPVDSTWAVPRYMQWTNAIPYETSRIKTFGMIKAEKAQAAELKASARARKAASRR